MKTAATTVVRLTCVALLTVATTASAQVAVTPGQLESSLDTGQTETHTVVVTNSSASSIDFRVMVGGDNPAGTIVDSLSYRTGSPSHMGYYVPGNAQDVESVAMRFSATQPLDLNAIRVGLKGLWMQEYTIEVAVHRIETFPFPDPENVDPTAGELLTTATHTHPAWTLESGSPGAIVAIPFDHPVHVAAGEEFFVVIAREAPGENVVGNERIFDPALDTADRAFWRSAGSGWGPLEAHSGGTEPPAWAIHALEKGIDWLDPLERTGTLAAGQSTELEVLLSAAGIGDGDYSGLIYVVPDGAPTAGADVVASLSVMSVPIIHVTPLELDFGAVLAQGSATDTVRVFNQGTAPLTISGMPADGPFHVEGSTSATVDPGDSLLVFVTFSPPDVGSYAGAITLVSNDPESPEVPVALSGEGLPAPEISVEPESLTAMLETGETETQVLGVSNNGQADLDFHITFSTPQARAAAATAAEVQSLAGELTEAPVGGAGNAYAPAGRDAGVYSDSLYYDTPGAYVQSYYFTSAVAVRYTPQSPFTLTAVRAYVDGVSSVLIDVHAFAEPNDPSAGPMLLSTVVDVPEGGPLKDLPLGASFSFEAGERFYVILRPISTDGTIGATQNGLPGGASFWYNNASGWNFMSSHWVIRALSSAGQLISAFPMMGTIPAGQTLDVDVTFDATGLFGGTYERLITFHSNDPVNPELDVPATLMVGDRPLISANPSELDFGDVFTGYSDTLAVMVLNAGSEPLVVSSVSSSHGAVTTNAAAGFTLQPAQQRSVRVAFAPGEDGSVAAEVILHSNDPMTPELSIAVFGEGVLPPSIAVEPGSLSSEISSGETETQTLTLTNEGPGVLDFAFSGYDGSARAYGGPDTFGYRFIDSNEPGGPHFDWVDITASGTALGLGNHDVAEVVLPFTFPFYGEMRDTLYVYSHGVLSFQLADHPGTMWFPKPLPHADQPDDIVAPMWLELAPHEHGEIYAGLDDLGRFVVTYHQVRGFWADDSHYTFQAILSPDGNILFQYDDIQGIRAHRASVGIENADASDGLSVVYREPYIHTGLAVQISTAPSWITSVEPASGMIDSGQSVDVSVVFDAAGLSGGDYSDNLVIASNDPEQGELLVPVSLSVDGDGGNMRTHLMGGWNLISTNLQLPEASPEAVFEMVMDRLEVVAKYHAGEWLAWQPGTPPESNTLTAIEPHYSYWVKLSEPGYIDLAGEMIDSQTPIELVAGHNAVGYLPSRAHLVEHALTSVGEATASVMTFYGSGMLASPAVPEEFQILAQMQPKMGYMLRSTAPVTLVYPDEAGTGNGETGEVPRPTLTGIMQAEAEAGVTATPVWIGVWGNDLWLADGTPLPPQAVVTAHLDDDQIVGAFHTVAEGRVGLMSIYGDDPFTEQKDGAVPGDVITIKVDGEPVTTITWTEQGDVFDISGVVVDTEPGPEGTALQFALEQNFPNPFSESTTLRFAIPEAQHVSLRVYDALGRRVTVLADGEYSAGVHDLVWEAGRAAAGVYFVRIDAGTFSDTRRVMVVR